MSDSAHRQAARVALTDRDQALEILAHLVSQLDPKDVLALIPDTAHREILERLAEVTRSEGYEGTELTIHSVYLRHEGRWVYEHGSHVTSFASVMCAVPLRLEMGPHEVPSEGSGSQAQ